MPHDRMPAALDREIRDQEHDAFGHRHFASALRSLIEAPDLTPPYSIGLLGGWGAGKSSIKALYISDLQSDEQGSPRRREVAHTVTFNAWRHSEDVKRALLRRVYLSIGGKEQTLREKLHWRTERTVNESPRFWDAFKDLLKIGGPAWLLVGAIVATILVLGVLFHSVLDVSADWTAPVVTAVMLVAAPFIAKQLLEMRNSARIPVTKIELPITTAEQYQDLLLDQLRDFKKDNARCKRLVVFVDDLDRLSSEEMVQGLDAVRAFMEIPESELPSDLGIVFVISCDEERIALALERGRQHRDNPAAVGNRFDARRYLDRSFQFRLEIPRFPRRDMRQYSNEKLAQLNLPEFDTPQASEVVERLIHVGVHDPRNALQLINAFAQSWWLAHRRETAEAGSTKPGILSPGVVTGNPLTLAALCALRVDFPDFYHDLTVQQRNLILQFNGIVLERVSSPELPEAVQDVLREYFEPNADDSGSFGPTVKRKWRPLRQYLATLQNHKWPKSIQPLLLLSQDAISRQYGDGQHALYDALLSGDTPGVLEALGRNADDRPLSDDDMKLLHGFMEDLSTESETRRVLASTVVAALIDRIDGARGHSLLGPLFRHIETSRALKSRVGVERIRSLANTAEAAEQTGIASSLVADVLRASEPNALTLPSGEPLNLDDATNMAEATCDFALEVRAMHGLLPQADSLLREWLLSRTVRTESKSTSLSFPRLFSWVEHHGEQLLDLLGRDYSDQLISYFETKQPNSETVESATQHLSVVFSQLFDAGPESQSVLWDQLRRALGVRERAIVQLGWQTLQRLSQSPSPDRFSRLHEALAARLELDMDDDEKWGLDWKPGGEALLALAEERRSELDAEAVVQFETLAGKWATDESTEEFAVRALPLLQPEREDGLIDSWIPNLFKKALPSICRAIGSHYEKLSENQRETLDERLTELAQTAEITKEEAAGYKALLDLIPEEQFSAAPLQEHLTRAIGRCATVGSAGRYLERVLPAIAPRLRHADPSTIGTHLHTLAATQKGLPNWYSWLHRTMAEYWPPPSDELLPYDPEEVFSDTVEFMEVQTDKDPAPLLDSLVRFIERGLVAETAIQELLDVACTVWPRSFKAGTRTLLAFDQAPTPERAAGIAKSFAWNEPVEVEELRKAWKHIQTHQTSEARAETAAKLLAEQPSEKDDPLALWVDTSPSKVDLLRGLLTDEELGDAAIIRTWNQAIRCRQELGAAFFLEFVPRLFRGRPEDAIGRAIAKSKSDLDAFFGDQESRHALVRAMLHDAFPEAPSVQAKGHLAAWAKSYDGDELVKKMDPDKLNPGDVEILKTHFGESTTRKLKKKVDDRDKD